MELGKPLRSICLTLGTLACLLASNATAQDLTLRVVGQNPRFRSQAPIPLELVLNWNTDKLIEGTLFVEVQDSMTVLMRYENPDVALGFGEFVLPLVLPPLSNEAESIEIKARFQSPVWGNFDLGTTTLKIPADWRRQLLIGMITPAGDEAVRNVFA
ncbi:MAG: hypothetical protein AB8G99_22605, partial [Planctomycetaceae bacterium]